MLFLCATKNSFSIFGNFIILDPLITFFKILLVLFALIFFIILKDYIKNLKYYDFEFIVIILFSLVGMLLLLHSNDLISFYVTIELQSLCFYVLVSSKQTSSFSTESGLKYFILGSFSSGLLLFGLILIYGFSGLFNFEELALYSQFLTPGYFTYNGILLGVFLVTVALLFKIGVVPFHMWIPDVYEGAPTIITALMSILPKLVFFFIFVKLHYIVFFSFFSIFHNFFIICATSSVIVGSIAALYQIKIKRMLTYSMIANSGFLILIFSLGNLNSLGVGFFYLFAYLLITIGIFILVLSFREKSNNCILKNISSLTNFYEVNPILAFSFFLFLFSIAGIPPLLGFYSKFFVFLACIKSNLFFITLIFVVLSIVSIFYYIRLAKLMFFNRTRN
jgi:NADH-quinone oxidoreductase subunit N